MLRLLDLFCGCGGGAMGYARAGFEVVGVDLAKQPDYLWEFHQADALRYPLDGFDVIHASPPCKVHSLLRYTPKPAALFDINEDLITPTRERLRQAGLPYVIENVPDAPLLNPVTYCGSSFGLLVRRHRLFESNLPLTAPPCDHASQPVVLGVYGTGGPDYGRAARGGGGGVKVSGQEAADALGVNWTTDQRRLSQAIPPAYTAHVGRQLMKTLSQKQVSADRF